MKRLAFLLVLVLAVSLASSRNVSAETIDAVHLKNGNVIRGVVTEMILNETVKIETADGSVFVYPFNEVEKITKQKKGGLTKTIDIIHLKNGSIIRGLIIEIIPDETIKIETADGSIFVYPFNEVEKTITTKILRGYSAQVSGNMDKLKKREKKWSEYEYSASDWVIAILIGILG